MSHLIIWTVGALALVVIVSLLVSQFGPEKWRVQAAWLAIGVCTGGLGIIVLALDGWDIKRDQRLLGARVPPSRKFDHQATDRQLEELDEAIEEHLREPKQPLSEDELTADFRAEHREKEDDNEEAGTD